MLTSYTTPIATPDGRYATHWKHSCRPDWPGWQTFYYGHIGNCAYVGYQDFPSHINLREIEGQFLINNMNVTTTWAIYVYHGGAKPLWGPKWGPTVHYNITCKFCVSAEKWVPTLWYSVGNVPHGSQVIFIVFNALTGARESTVAYTLP